MNEKISVALFVFNRPDTVIKVVEALRRYCPSRLYIIADGPRQTSDDSHGCIETIRVVKSGIDWPCAIKWYVSDSNLGCRLRIKTGLDQVFAQEEACIILEDDCVPTLSFFDFCEKIHRKYRSNPLVFGACGESDWPKNNAEVVDVSWSKYFLCWGWLGFRHGWLKHTDDMSNWPMQRASGIIQRNSLHRSAWCGWRASFNAIYEGRLNTWDYQVTLSLWRTDMLVAVPSKRLVENIGIGHVKSTHGAKGVRVIRRVLEAQEPIIIQEPVARALRRDAEIEYSFFCSKTLIARLVHWCKSFSI